MLWRQAHWPAFLGEKMKKNKLILFFLCLFSLPFIGCVSTDIDGIVKDNVKLTEYNNILIFCNIENYKYRKQLETEFQKQFSINNIVSYKSLDIFSPLENYTDLDYQNFINEKDIEILLEVRILSSDAYNGNSSSFVMPVGGLYFGRGNTEVNLTINFDISIYDVQSKETVFKGTATSEEDDDEISDCIESIFKSLAKDMVETYFVEKIK